MLMVLVVHSDFKTFGIPNSLEIDNYPSLSYVRIFLEALSLPSVIIFVMISGWFGIKSSIRGFLNFIFQVLYFQLLSFGLAWISGKVDFSLMNIAHIFCLPSCGWFVISYLGLYILAPIYNNYLDTVPQPTQRNVLISFFALQTYFGFIGDSINFNFGYSTLSFSGLYLLAGYVRRHQCKWNKLRCARIWGGIIYLSVTCTTAIIMSIAPFTIGRMMQYTNPLLIIASLALIIQCNRINLKFSKSINFIASSAFSVYLLHDNIFISHDFFIPLIKFIGVNYGFLAIAGVIIGIFVLSVLLDQPRKLLWTLLQKVLF